MQKSYLSLSLVNKSFKRGNMETEVLKGISLDVAKGEYVSLIGHSGCGKSTLLGRILING